MNSDKHILIIEDEPKIAQILVDFLHLEGYQTQVLLDGAEAVETIRNQQPDLVILDIMLPSKDGLSICKEVRLFSHVPVLMLTARVDEIDRLVGLGFGADDYVCKPFSPREVVARVQAILRRTQHQTATNDKQITYKSLTLDLDRHECKLEGQVVLLTPVEFRLLRTLLAKPGSVCSRDKLMNSCYDDSRIVSSRTIDSHMKNLRSKLAVVTERESLLHSIYGVGYKIE